jgi:hypothetical protein
MIVFAAIGAVLASVVLWDVFEVIVLPRRIERTFRPARFFFLLTWHAWSSVAGRMRGSPRESVLGIYGPLFLLMLLAAWAVALVLSYALIYWGLGGVDGPESNFGTDLYFSGTTFFTLGLGDFVPASGSTRAVAALQSATGFGFLALVIGYLPTFYQAFSRREVSISLLDARAGSPPSAGELIRRFSEADDMGSLASLLVDWERWSAELLESHLSYPVLMSFRSQHERQSWVAALTAILDTSAVIIASGAGREAHVARLTFAMARHAAVDLSASFDRAPAAMPYERLPAEDLRRLHGIVTACDSLTANSSFDRTLTELRAKYEPFVWTLAENLLVELPPWVAAADGLDAWQTSLPARPTSGHGVSPSQR